MGSYQSLLIGKSGFLGQALTSGLLRRARKVIALGRSDIDLTKKAYDSTKICAEYTGVQSIILCAAITDVEICFSDQETSKQVNVTGTIEVLEAARDLGIKPVFFSSDYVFGSGNAPFSEDDLRSPQTVYGQQKLFVERYIENNFDQYLIFRTSKLMAKSLHPKNILTPLISGLSNSKYVRCFEDQWINPIFVEDIADVLSLALDRGLSGTFHLGTSKVFSRKELGDYIANVFGFDQRLVQAIRMNSIQFSEPRTSHNTLNSDKIRKVLDFKFQEISDAIPELLKLIL